MNFLSSRLVNSKDVARRDCVEELCSKFGEEHRNYFGGLMNRYFVGEYDPYINEKVKAILAKK